MRRAAARVAALAVTAALVIAAGACSGDDTPDTVVGADADARATTTVSPRLATGLVTVLAEPDLAPAMSASGAAFEEVNPEASVQVESLPAAEIAARVQGGKGDVVVMSDAPTMDDLEGTGAVAAALPLSRSEAARAAAVVASANPEAATRFVEFLSRS